MKKLTYLFLITTTLLFSCGEEKSGSTNNPDSKEIKKEDENVTSNNSNNHQWSNGEYYFKGLINFKYAFHMRFTVENNSISGAYYYNSQRKEIELNGSIINGNLEVDESYKDKITGHFSSNVFTSDSISGIWKSPKGLQFTFALFHSKEEEYIASLEGVKKSEWTKEEFENFIAQFELTQLPFEYAPVSVDNPDIEIFDENQIVKFAYPEYDPEVDFGYRFIFGKKFETEKFIAIVYTEVYIPGAFGIFNHSLIMKTFDKNGNFIDEKYLGCECYDNNYDDYYSTSEKFKFTKNSIIVTGEETHASQEWAEEESGTEPFDNRSPINRTIKLTEEGKFL